MKTPGIRNLTALLLVLAFISGTSISALAASGQLIIKATGFKNHKGQVLFAVVDSPEAYDLIEKKAFTKSTLKLTSENAQVSFTLPYGWYAVSVVHDQNSNDKLDSNFLGIPKEPYGFSNNPKSMGKPSFDDAKFKLDAAQKIIEVTVE
jgi:uncharacterized protein (DUF2141 family)